MNKVFILTVVAWLMSLPLALAQEPATEFQSLPEASTAAKASAPIVGSSLSPCNFPSSRCWGSAEYLLWWVKDAPSNFPLVTSTTSTATVNGLPPGALGRPDTQVVFGGSNFNYGAFSGGRLTLGTWLDSNSTLGVEASGFLFERKAIDFLAQSGPAGTPQYYIPVFRTDKNREGSYTISEPATGLGVNGAVNFATSLQLWGAEANSVLNIRQTATSGLVLLTGFRYLNLQESITAGGNTSFFVPPSQNDQVSMGFNTLNEFFGAQVGARGYWNFGKFSTEATLKVALGATYQSVNVQGTDIVTNSGGGAIPNGHYSGFGFAQPTNIGHESRTAFGVVPQLTLKVGYNFTPNIRATLGYDFLYWSNVVRPGDQIDRNINFTQLYGGALSGPATPARLFQGSDFFAQGLSVGLEFKF